MEAKALADALHDPFDKASVYIAIAQNLPPEERPPLIINAWTLLRKIEDGYDRASVVIAIAPYLPAPARPDLIKMAHTVIDTISDEYDKASAIGILVPLLTEAEPDAAESEVLPRVVDLVIESLKAGLDAANPQSVKVQRLTQALPVWMQLSGDEQYAVWRMVAGRLKALPLADVLLCLSGLVSILHRMGGDTTVEKITQLLSMQRDKPHPGGKS
jgi:hypothetical protein